MPVRFPGRPCHRQLTGPVAGRVSARVAFADLRGLVGGGRRGELRVQHAPVAGEGAAAPVQRHGDVIGDLARDGQQRVVQAELHRRAGRMHRQRFQPGMIRQPGQHPLGDQRQGVDHPHLRRAVAQHLHQTLGATRRVAHQRQFAATGRGDDGGHHAFLHSLVAARHPLRRPRGATAQRIDITGDQQPDSGQRAQLFDTVLHTGAVAGRAEHRVDTGRQVHRVSFAHRCRPAPGPAAARKLLRPQRHGVGAGEGAPGAACGRGQHGGNRGRSGQRAARRPAGGAPVPGGQRPAPLGQPRVVLPAQPAHQIAGVDLHRARRAAHAVHGAGLHAGIVVGFRQLVGQRVVAY